MTTTNEARLKEIDTLLNDLTDPWNKKHVSEKVEIRNKIQTKFEMLLNEIEDKDKTIDNLYNQSED